LSIIHDALKKTEGALQSPQDNPPEGPSPEVASYLKKKRRRNRIEWVIFYLLAVILGLYIGNIPFDLAGKANTLVKNFNFSWLAVKKQAGPGALQKKDASLLKKIPILSGEKKESDELVLNGIFFSKDGSYAVINNQIVKVGEMVNDATVREIQEDEVTLEYRGGVLKLSTR